MKRLFIALDLPATETASLLSIQPSPRPGIRLTPPSEMHVTLHFLGDYEVNHAAKALAAVKERSFAIAIRGVGHFPPLRDASTLWARVEPNADLLRLHAALAAELAGIGFRPEARVYTPHITLARCDRGVPQAIVDEFLKQHAELYRPDVLVNRFALYSSQSQNDGPHYQREQEFSLLTQA